MIVGIENYTSVPTLVVSYGGNTFNCTPDQDVGVSYTSGDITVNDGTNTYTLLGSKLTTFGLSSVSFWFFDKITVNNPVYTSTLYYRNESAELLYFSGYTNSLMVSNADQIILSNLGTTGIDGWYADTYSSYIQVSTPLVSLGPVTVPNVSSTHWMIIIIILLVIVFSAIAGIYFYKKEKNTM